MSDWNSSQYLKFKKERTQPSTDLVNRISLDNPGKIIDIGCGPGNSTKELYNRFPNAHIVGVDKSSNMLEKAKEKYSYIEFAEFDAASDDWNLGNDFDIVFSNACLQWVPNHKELLPKLMDLLKPGGVLAVQIPIQYNEPIHKIISRVSTNMKWKNKLHVSNPFYILSNDEYYDILSGISNDFEMWTTTYYHKMKNHIDIIEWYKSTGLKPYLEALDEKNKQQFINDIYEEVVKYYKRQANGEVIFRFPRLFFVAEK